MLKPSGLFVFLVLLLAIQPFNVIPSYAKTVQVDDSLLEELQQIIRQQQQQIQSLQQRVDNLEKTATQAQIQATEAKATAEQVLEKTKDATAAEQKLAGNMVTSGEERVKLSISGQVNRATNVADDGKNTKVYFVDSDASNSRVRFVGAAKLTEDVNLGSRIEIALAPNESSQVSQDNEDSGDFFDQRWAELSLGSQRFGKLSVGKGSTASDNSAEVDLSGIGIIAYSSVTDPAAGLKFRENRGDRLTNITLFDAFDNFDGLGRKNRVRYDSPSFKGFQIAASTVSNQRWDASLWWGGQGYGFKAAGAAAIAEPNQDDTDYQYSGSFSMLHESTGLNLSLSAGLKDRKSEGDPTNLYAKAGWLTRFFSFGQTGFGIDFDRSNNQPTGKDDAYSIGAAMVQQIEDYGTEVYLQYRTFSLNRDADPSVQDVKVGTLGTRIKF
jgi:hypothetical protein